MPPRPTPKLPRLNGSRVSVRVGGLLKNRHSMLLHEFGCRLAQLFPTRLIRQSWIWRRQDFSNLEWQGLRSVQVTGYEEAGVGAASPANPPRVSPPDPKLRRFAGVSEAGARSRNPERFVRRISGEGCWCERGDSNPHGFPRQILSLVRLPIPPLSRVYFQ
jgi:hypothetical protein